MPLDARKVNNVADAIEGVLRKKNPTMRVVLAALAMVLGRTIKAYYAREDGTPEEAIKWVTDALRAIASEHKSTDTPY